MKTPTAAGRKATMRSFRCKTRGGYSCFWRVGPNKDGKFKALSVGRVKIRNSPVPTDFLPFDVMDAVLNRAIVFDTIDAAEQYVRSL